MDPLVSLATFAVIFPAELPDKSMFAAVIMGTRFKPLPVWLGLAAAFLIHVVIAVAAGGVISLLPHRIVLAVVTIFFLAGVPLLLFNNESAESDGQEEAERAGVDQKSATKIAATSFGVIFVSEWGDLTQIATVNLTARYDDPVSVAVGAVAALWLVTGLGVLLGNRLVNSVPMALVRRIAAAVLFALAVWSLVDLLHG